MHLLRDVFQHVLAMPQPYHNQNGSQPRETSTALLQRYPAFAATINDQRSTQHYLGSLTNSARTHSKKAVRLSVCAACGLRRQPAAAPVQWSRTATQRRVSLVTEAWRLVFLWP